MVPGLSKALVNAGHDVRVVLPHYPGLLLDNRDHLWDAAIGIAAGLARS